LISSVIALAVLISEEPSKLPSIKLLLPFLILCTVNGLLIPSGGLPLLSSDELEGPRPPKRVSPDAVLPGRLESQYYFGKLRGGKETVM
jgi:hypothetical protein